MKSHNSLLAGLIIFLMIVYCPLASHAGTVLDLGDPIGVLEAPQAVAMQFFCSEVAKRTNGEITIKYHPATIVTNEIKAVEMVKTGALAFCGMGGSTTTIFPNVQPLELPYILRDHKHYYDVMWGPIGKEMEDEILKRQNVKVVYWYDFSFRCFHNSKRPIYKPEDMKGLKIRIIQSPPLRDLVNALGASAVPISWAETIPALQQGVVDGICLWMGGTAIAKVYQLVKYTAITNHIFTSSPVIVNFNVWKSLSSEQQRIILQVGKEASVKNWHGVERADAGAVEIFEKYGNKVTRPDLEPFKQIAIREVHPKYYGKFGKELIERIMAVK